MSRCLQTPSPGPDAARLPPRVLLAGALAAALAGGTFACTDDQALPTGPELAKGGNTAPLAVSPTSVILSLTPVTPATLTAKATAAGTITAATSDAACATVSPASAAAVKPMGSSVYQATFTVTPVGAGSCTVTLDDTRGNQAQTQVVVSAVRLRPETVVGGVQHACGLTAAGAAYCWGNNFSGQLGSRKNLGTFNPNPAPAAVSGNLSFVSLAAGYAHSCGLTAAGAAYCWGSNGAGALGSTKRLGSDNLSVTPVAVEGGHRFVALTAGQLHTCGLTDAATAWCWGFNFFGQLGTTVNAGVLGVATPTPQQVSGGHSFVGLEAGSSHTCGLTATGAAWCWGDNTFGAMGDPASVGQDDPHPTPFPISGGIAFVELTAGGAFTCGLDAAGTAYCWGGNNSGELGSESELALPRTTPEPVSGGLQFAEVQAGLNHACGRTGAGAGYCWGANVAGQLGTTVDNNTHPSRHPAPMAVDGGLSFAALAAGTEYSCGLSGAGAAYCWGLNDWGQLGYSATAGNTTANPAPTAVSGGLTFGLP